MKRIILIAVFVVACLGTAKAQNPAELQRIRIILNVANYPANNLPLLLYDVDGRTLATKDFSLLTIDKTLKAAWVKEIKVIQIHEKADKYSNGTLMLVKLKANHLDSIPAALRKMFQ